MTARAGAFCALFLLCALAPSMVVARPVYRCGPDKARTYSHTPCPSGIGRVVDVADARDADQWSEAADVAQHAVDSGRKMEKERRRDEAARKRAIGIHGAGVSTGEPVSTPTDQKQKAVRAAKATCPKGMAQVTRPAHQRGRARKVGLKTG